MKRITICMMLLLFSASTFGQDTIAVKQTLTRAEYLSKSKTEKVFAFILLGAGATTLLLLSKGNTDLGSIGVLVVVGGLATLASIPLFISSAKNKRRAKNAAASFKFERIPTLEQSGISFHSVPAISLKISL